MIELFQKKNPNRGEVEPMEFPEVLKKEYVEIPGINLRRSGISRGDSEKIIWNSDRSW